MGLFTFVHMQNKQIFLIGFMGAGKTTLGNKIAEKLGVSFIDIDQEIESLLGMTISSVFEKNGEEFFRTQESKMLLDVILSQKQAIVSVGGGLPCFNNNMELMNKSGLTCYLKSPAEELYRRLKNSTINRPLLKELNDEELLRFIESKLLEREKYYNEAKLIVPTEDQYLDRIIELLKV